MAGKRPALGTTGLIGEALSALGFLILRAEHGVGVLLAQRPDLVALAGQPFSAHGDSAADPAGSAAHGNPFYTAAAHRVAQSGVFEVGSLDHLADAGRPGPERVRSGRRRGHFKAPRSPETTSKWGQLGPPWGGGQVGPGRRTMLPTRTLVCDNKSGSLRVLMRAVFPARSR